MEALICLVFWMTVIAGAILRSRLNRRDAAESLCLACVNAVVTRGAHGKVMVACNVAGAMRPVKFAVCQCTAFCVKAGPAKLVTIEGFVRNEREVYAEVAIRS
jgi:hypothetical protein